MPLPTFHKIIEDRIDRSRRRGQRILTASRARDIRYATQSDASPAFRPKDLFWTVRYMEGFLRARTGISSSLTFNTLTMSTTETGTAGVWDIAAKTWTDSSKARTVNQWSKYYLKVDGDYYLVASNTATILTVTLSNGIFISGGNYTIVPFVPKSLRGAYLNPDTTKTHRFKIAGNTETVITIMPDFAATGEPVLGVVSSNSANGTYFKDSERERQPNDTFNDMSVYFLSGVNNNSSSSISDFSGVADGGKFFLKTTMGFSPQSGNRYSLQRDLLYADAGDTWRIEVYYPIQESDFTAADPEDIFSKRIDVGSGALIEQRFPRGGYAGLYVVEILSEVRRSFSLPVNIPDSVRGELVNVATDEAVTIIDSNFKPNITVSVPIILDPGIWYQLRFFVYTEFPTHGIMIGDIVSKVNQWRPPIPAVPTWVSATGIDSGGSYDPSTAQENQITLNWINDLYVGEGYTTEIWWDSGTAPDYNLLDTISTDATFYIVRGVAVNTAINFKIRHVTPLGDVSDYSAIRAGKTLESGYGAEEPGELKRPRLFSGPVKFAERF